MNLTWEIEEVQLERDEQQQWRREDVGERVAGGATSLPLSFEHAFVVYYCEMQSWGPQRCKSKVLKDTAENHIDSGVGEGERDEEDGGYRTGREYSMVIDNLRMATKYSFHVRQLSNAVAGKPKGREMDGDVEDEEEEDKELSANDIDKGQTIIIPTKGCKWPHLKLINPLLIPNFNHSFQSLPTPRSAWRTPRKLRSRRGPISAARSSWRTAIV